MTIMIAGRVSLESLMEELARTRPVFHSEADLQHAFARALWERDSAVQSRLEVRQALAAAKPGSSEYVDLVCRSSDGGTAVEFKYFTRAWSGTAGQPSERFELRTHGAEDLLRLHFVADIERLERFCEASGQDGIALLVTNEPRLWRPTPPSKRQPRDAAFRLHGGRTLRGAIHWAAGTYPANDRLLRGEYTLAWREYSKLDDGGAKFMWLAVRIAPPVS